MEESDLKNFRVIDGGLLIGDALIIHGDMLMREHHQISGEGRLRYPAHYPERDIRRDDSCQKLHELLKNRADNSDVLPYEIHNLDGIRKNLEPSDLKKVKHVIYGHTHVGHGKRLHEGVNFYNTGSFEYREMFHNKRGVHALTANLTKEKELTNIGFAATIKDSKTWKDLVKHRGTPPKDIDFP